MLADLFPAFSDSHEGRRDALDKLLLDDASPSFETPREDIIAIQRTDQPIGLSRADGTALEGL